MKFNINRSKPKVKYKFEDIKSDELILHHHLGLGDHISCNGIVNYLSLLFNQIYIPVKSKNFKMVEFMFQSNKKVKLIELTSSFDFTKKMTNVDVANISNEELNQVNEFGTKNNLEILRVGHEKATYPVPKSFYDQLGLPFSFSKDYFETYYDSEKNKKLERHLIDCYKSNEEYIVVHHEGSQSSYFDKMKGSINLESVIKIEKKTDIFNNIFFYLDILANANEIHCISSSIFTLADRVKTKGNLFLHNVNNEPNFEETNSCLNPWKIIEYNKV